MRFYSRFEVEKLRVNFISSRDGNTGQVWSGFLDTNNGDKIWFSRFMRHSLHLFVIKEVKCGLKDSIDRSARGLEQDQNQCKDLRGSDQIVMTLDFLRKLTIGRTPVSLGRSLTNENPRSRCLRIAKASI